MANIAILVSRQMVVWFPADSDSGSTELTIVTTLATTGNVCMVKCRPWKTGGYVAVTAIVQCRDMIRRLAGCKTSGMARRAVGGIYDQVVKNYSCKGTPTRCVVAIITID